MYTNDANYDSDLQMVRERPTLNAAKLRFYRWMAENGYLNDDLPLDQPITHTAIMMENFTQPEQYPWPIGQD